MAESRSERLFYDMMDKVLGCRMPEHTYFVLHDGDGHRTYVGEARFVDPDGRYVVEPIIIRRLRQGESVIDYLRSVADTKPKTVICDAESTGRILNETYPHCFRQRGGRYLIPFNEKTVKIFPASCPSRLTRCKSLAGGFVDEQSAAAPTPKKNAAPKQPTPPPSPAARDELCDLVKLAQEQNSLPEKFFAAVQDPAANIIYGIFLQQGDDGVTPIVGLWGYKNDPVWLADWLLQYAPKVPLIASRGIVDEIMNKATGITAGYLRIAERNGKRLEMVAPLSVHKDMRQCDDPLKALIAKTLSQGRIPEHTYGVIAHPKNTLYYGTHVRLEFLDDARAASDLVSPFAHLSQSANDIAVHLMKNYPGLPLLCEPRTLDDLCIVSPEWIPVSANHCTIINEHGKLEVYSPNVFARMREE